MSFFQKNTSFITVTSSFVLLATPVFAFAGVSEVLLNIQDILNAIVPVVVGIGLITFFWGVVKLMGAADDAKKRSDANSRMIFGIIVLAVMIGVWGLVALVVSTFDLNTAPPTVDVGEGVGGGTIGEGGTGEFGPGPTPLVPCGRSDQSSLCTACDLYRLIHNVMNYLMYLAVPLAVLSISIGGAYILFGAGVNQSWISTGKEFIWNALIGLLIVFGAWLIINTIMTQLAHPGIFSPPWSEIRC